MAKHHKAIRKQLYKLGFLPFNLQGVFRLAQLKPGSKSIITTKLHECPAMQNLKECLRYAKGT